jgi:uncharacterized damage-inducible protein DinB
VTVTTLVEHAQSLLAYHAWADDRILAAADGISAADYAQLQAPFEHMLGTWRFWHANWAGTWGQMVLPVLPTLAKAREDYAASHEALRSYARALTQEELDRSEQWWLRWGYEGKMALGESVTQIFYHGIQHRSEIAVVLTSLDRSPGDLDYLTFLRESGAAVPAD